MNNDYILKLAAEFPFFLREFWGAMDLDKYGRIGWFEEDIAEFVQNGPERRGVLAYRSSGKTHLITTAYSCWRLYRDPDWKISIFSKSAGFAGRITGYVRDALGICPFLQHLKPRKDQKDTAIEFMVNGASASKQPSIRGVGIGSQTAGNRANTIIGDDIEDATNSMTVDARDRLFNAAIGLNAQLFKVNEEIPLDHPSNQRDMIFVGYIEHETDTITHRCVEALHKTFITPLDREEIHQLISNMDDVLDLMQDVAESVSLYDIKAVTPEAKQLAEICLQCSERVKSAVALLPNMDNAATILKICEEIDRLESDADHVMRSAISKLFRTERDAVQLIKLKAIYELLETVTDRCEDVANVMQGIVIENA